MTSIYAYYPSQPPEHLFTFHLPLTAAGAAKRFSFMFKDLGYDIVTCGKVRDGDKRRVSIQVKPLCFVAIFTCPPL